jgi:hypothetical protein
MSDGIDYYYFDDGSFDGLRLCSVCGDRETTDDVCWSCRQQEMIDNDTDYNPEALPDADDQPDFEPDDCQVSGHQWEYVGNGCYQCTYCGAEDCDY